MLLLENNATPGIFWSSQNFIVNKRIQNFYPHALGATGQMLEHIWCDPPCK